MLSPLWTETWTFIQHCKSLDFVHALRQLPKIDGQPPSQFTKWWLICLQEVGRQVYPLFCKEGLPLIWGHIDITKIDLATNAVVTAFAVHVAVFTRLADTIILLLGTTEIARSFLLDSLLQSAPHHPA